MGWHGGFSGLGFTRAEFRKWLAAQAKPTYPKFLVVHNTASPYIVPPVTASTRIKNLGNYYQNDVKWSSGPNLIVIKDKVYGGTPLQFPGTNSPGFNGKSIGVECEGDYRQGKHDPLKGDGKIAWDTMAWVFAELCEWFGWPIDGEHIKLHREDPKTTHACPGNLVGKDWFLEKVKAASAAPQAPLPQPASPTPTRATIKIGATGGDVPVLQRYLKTKGYYTALVDGDFGPKTEAAVKAIQKALGLVVDGIVGPITWAALSRATGKPQEAPKPPVGTDTQEPTKPAPTPPKPAEQTGNTPKPKTNPELAVQILTSDVDWPRHWAKAMVGHQQRESYPDLKPHVEGDWMLDGKPVKKGTPGAVSTAYGINQWRADRKDKLVAFAAARGKPWDDFESQVLFGPYELKTSEKLAWSWLQKAETLEQAVQALCFYERPRGYIASAGKAAETWADVEKVAKACDGYKERLAFASALK